MNSNERNFTILLLLAAMLPFLSWVLSLSPEMTVAEPKSVREDMRRFVESAAKEYGR